jgi:hypothetical protein
MKHLIPAAAFFFGTVLCVCVGILIGSSRVVSLPNTLLLAGISGILIMTGIQRLFK